MVTYAQQQITIYLRQDQIEALQALSATRGVSRDELIQAGVDTFLRAAALADAIAQADAPDNQEPPPPDSLDDLMGMFDSGLSDLSINHDKYLAEAVEAESHRWPQKSS
jgi:hypothetical protein